MTLIPNLEKVSLLLGGSRYFGRGEDVYRNTISIWRHLMRRLLPLVLSLAIACGSDSPLQPTSASVAGTWNLQTVNGTALPYLIAQSGTTKVELVSDVVTAVATGSYTEITQLRTTVDGQVMDESFPDAGSFTLNGTAVVFQSNSDGSQTTGSVSGNTFTLAGDGFAYVYKRQ